MADVNEEIVRQYFELKGYLVRTRVPFNKPKEKTGKKSSGYGDIDLIVTNPKTGDRAIVGVTGWQTERITPSYAKTWGHRLFSFTDPLALKKATEVLGTDDFRKVLVVSQLGSREQSKRSFIEKAQEHSVDEVIEFPDILDFLIKEVDVRHSPDSEVLQIIRVLKLYNRLIHKIATLDRFGQG